MYQFRLTVTWLLFVEFIVKINGHFSHKLKSKFCKNFIIVFIKNVDLFGSVNESYLFAQGNKLFAIQSELF